MKSLIAAATVAAILATTNADANVAVAHAPGDYTAYLVLSTNETKKINVINGRDGPYCEKGKLIEVVIGPEKGRLYCSQNWIELLLEKKS